MFVRSCSPCLSPLHGEGDEGLEGEGSGEEGGVTEERTLESSQSHRDGNLFRRSEKQGRGVTDRIGQRLGHWVDEHCSPCRNSACSSDEDSDDVTDDVEGDDDNDDVMVSLLDQWTLVTLSWPLNLSLNLTYKVQHCSAPTNTQNAHWECFSFSPQEWSGDQSCGEVVGSAGQVP